MNGTVVICVRVTENSISSDRSGKGEGAGSLGPGGLERHWGLFAEQARKDARFWVFAFGTFTVLRWLMLVIFSEMFGPAVDVWEILKCLYAGARFDAAVATFWVLPCLLGSVLAAATFRRSLAEKTRFAIVVLFIVASAFLGVVSIGFFAEYKDHFNHWVFGLIFDDMKAVLRTLWKDYPLIPAVVGILAVAAGMLLLWRRLFEKAWLVPGKVVVRLASWPVRILALLCLVGLVIIGARGSAGRRPVQLKDAAITKDRVLNKLVLNPYSALRYAVSQQLEVMRGKDLRVLWPGGDIIEAVKVAFPLVAEGSDLDAFLARVAQGPPATPAKHVFLVVMESYDAWPLMDRHRSLQLCEGVRTLARNGVLIPAFVSDGSGTMLSINALVTGLPDSGLVVNYMRAGRKPFPTSIASVFKRLGYRTRAFYAGYLSWQRFGDFCAEQDFDEIHGGGDIDESGLLKREWGVEDDKLLDYVARHVPAEPASFNMILSAGYHPPFTMDVFGLGYPVRAAPPDLRSSFSGRVNLKVLGHLWFSDRCLSNFVLQVEKRLPAAVFAVTGDHWSRRFINERPNVYERSAVLMLWHGSEVLPKMLKGDQLAGSHLDILPTLVELAAPPGFTYHAFGHNLFDLRQPQIGFGVPAIVTPDWFMDPTEPSKVLALSDMTERVATPQERAFARQWQARRAVGWWRVVNGPGLSHSSP